MKKIAFYRNYQEFTGGHLKVWDYFNHVKISNIFTPNIYFTGDSKMDFNNPWVRNYEKITTEWLPENSDIVFLAGTDWLSLCDDYEKPVINLIQGVRHADKNDVRFNFLERHALRICVSHEVADAILSTGKVNGPVFIVNNGLDSKEFPDPASMRDIMVLIAGYKKPKLALDISENLKSMGIGVNCLTTQLVRNDYLSLISRAFITIFLPDEREGFYLPALEGMALGTLVICPDCVGNRGFCLHNENSLMPTYELNSILSACLEALEFLSKGTSLKITTAAYRKFQDHSLKRERDEFLRILNGFKVE